MHLDSFIKELYEKQKKYQFEDRGTEYGGMLRDTDDEWHKGLDFYGKGVSKKGEIDPEDWYGYYWSYLICRDVIKGKNRNWEDRLSKHPRSGYKYAKWIIKGRWEKAEKAILTSPTYSMKYAVEVLNSRWPDAEEVINQNELSSLFYNYFLETKDTAIIKAYSLWCLWGQDDNSEYSKFLDSFMIQYKSARKSSYEEDKA